MFQIYCDDEAGINRWLKENKHKEIVNIQMTINESGEYIMVTYKTAATREEIL